MPTILPTIPPEPTDSDALEKWVHYRWAVSENNKAAHADAQAATAAAMAENARVQAELVAAMNRPEPRRAWTQGDVVRMLTPLIPMRVGDTEATYAKVVNEQALKLLPMLNA